jgi:hypothetical protein
VRHVERPPYERGPRILLLPLTHFRELDGWRRLALAGAIVVACGSVMSFPDFGWIEAAQLLVAVSCVRMVARHVESHPFASPFADGTLLATGGLWAAVVAFGNAFFDGADTRSQIVVVAGSTALFLAGMFIRFDEGRRWYETDYAD